MDGSLTGIVFNSLVAHGLVILVIVFVLEGLIIGKLLPTEAILVAAILVFSPEPSIRSVGIIVLSAASATLGQVAMFTLVRSYGRDAVLSNRGIRVSETRLATLDTYFARWGLYVIPISNVVPVIRGLFTLPAATSSMEIRDFAGLVYIGTLCYHAIWLCITMVAGTVMIEFVLNGRVALGF